MRYQSMPMAAGAFLLASAFFFPSAGYAQLPPDLTGTWQGHITNRGNGNDAFQLVIRQNASTFEGTAQVFKGLAECQEGQVPMKGTFRDETTVFLDAPGRQKNCDRQFFIRRQPDGKLGGDITGPMGISRFFLERK